jgi:hypothetical protein
MLWNLYGYIVQDEAMRMIKHSGGAVNLDGRSAFYEATSVMSLLKGDADTMYRGTQVEKDAKLSSEEVSKATNDNEYVDGFLQNINKYWDAFDPNNTRHSGALQKAVLDYVNATAQFCYANYKKADQYNVSGHHTGRLMGNNTKGLSLALDIARRKCTNNEYKLFNVLNRGYFLHAEKTRLTKGNADSLAKLFVQQDLGNPMSAIDVAQACRILAQREIRIPSYHSMALAFKLDNNARNGWFAQHSFIGRLKVTASDNNTCVVKWVSMVVDATNHEAAKAIRLAQQALSDAPDDINYPDADNWGG